MRKLKKRRQEMNGWPITSSWRDRGEWNPDPDTGEVRFYRMTAGRMSTTSWPRAAWRGR